VFSLYLVSPSGIAVPDCSTTDGRRMQAPVDCSCPSATLDGTVGSGADDVPSVFLRLLIWSVLLRVAHVPACLSHHITRPASPAIIHAKPSNGAFPPPRRAVLCCAVQMRHEIDLLLLELWQDTRCRSCIKQQASKPGGMFAGFVSAVLNDLMYLFKDSLERLADIKQIEDSRKDTQVCEGVWWWVGLQQCLGLAVPGFGDIVCRCFRTTLPDHCGQHRVHECCLPLCLQVWSALSDEARKNNAVCECCCCCCCCSHFCRCELLFLMRPAKTRRPQCHNA
jgi:hypothetical protein